MLGVVQTYSLTCLLSSLLKSEPSTTGWLLLVYAVLRYHNRVPQPFTEGYLRVELEINCELALVIWEQNHQQHGQLFSSIHYISRCGWKPESEIRGASISIPTVNIHYLGNVDILREFVWRILWAGWNCRSNFDNFSMSLFGVISSTPSGSELANANVVCIWFYYNIV